MGAVSYKPLIDDMTWSYSRVRSFEDCPYRWFLKYIHGANGKEMFFSSYGKFMHELIAAFYSGEKTAKEAELEYLLRFEERVDPHAPSGKVLRNYFRDGLEYLRNLRPPEEQVVGVEQEIAFLCGDRPFIGVLDLLQQGDDFNLILTDNKSRALKPRSKRKKPTKTDGELDEYLKQFYLYSSWVKEKYGKFPKVLRINCFRTGMVIEEPFSEQAYENAIAWAKARVEEISDETEFRPSVEFFKCRYLCEQQDNCEYYELS